MSAGTLSIQRVKIPWDGENEAGLLVFSGEVLAAVLICLDAHFYGSDRGHWHLEVGFGRCAVRQAAFDTLELALRWIAGCNGLDPDAATTPALNDFRSRSRPH